MAAEYTNASQQTINPGESVIFTESPVPCTRGLVRHRDGTGNFLLRGVTNGCPCVKSANYLVDFGADIAIPTGGTVGEISVAIAIDGSTIPASTMTVTPAAVEEFFNISRATTVPIWRGCCQTLTVRNISEIPILAQNANIIFSRPDLAVSY
jgi:hypothetical protein